MGFLKIAQLKSRGDGRSLWDEAHMSSKWGFQAAAWIQAGGPCTSCLVVWAAVSSLVSPAWTKVRGT